MAAMLMDSGQAEVINCDIGALPSRSLLLQRGAMPVGSVEFVRQAMKLAGIHEPAAMSYPPGCEPFLHRQIRRVPIVELRGRQFVKPTTTKSFNGFVLDADAPLAQYLDEHDLEQHTAMRSLPADTLVYASEVVQFQCEWRYYVLGGLIIGAARYDPDGLDDAPEPDLVVINACMASLAIQHPYALDIGVLADGRTAVVEVNDAWAIGWYRNSLKPMAYLEFLLARWRCLLNRRDPHARTEGCA
ncbi:MAG: ATP-grasp domain-containing protein [Caldisericota bacterium]|nr:ATP-grasp domain-containing protein [Caldisericota bacterium]